MSNKLFINGDISNAKSQRTSHRVVVSYGVGGSYPRGVGRLISSIHGEEGVDVLAVMGSHPDWIPRHKDKPYAFKSSLIQAARDAGYTTVLWLDAADWFVGSPAMAFSEIESRQGYFLLDGWKIRQWCSDECLRVLSRRFGIAQETLDVQLRDATLLYANLIGWDFTNPLCTLAFEHWRDIGRDTIAFEGAWTNKDGEVSTDPFVLGHRHDQTVLSFLTWHFGLNAKSGVWCGNSMLHLANDATPKSDRPEVLVNAQGLN